MSLINLSKKNVAVFCALLVMLGVAVLPTLISAQQAPAFLTGDIMTATNNTTGNGTWSDPVSANPGEVIEFRVVAQNVVQNSVATNVVVTANLPTTPSNPIIATGTVSASNASSVSDTLTVNVLNGTLQSFAYIPGHARIFSASCPQGCAGPDTVTTSGVNVGNLAFGESAQVAFKAYVTNVVGGPVVSPTPSPTVNPTPSPTPTPTPSVAPVTPTPTPQGAVTVQCPAGTTQSVNGSSITCIVNTANANATGGAGGSANVTIANPSSSQVVVAQPKVMGVAAAPGVSELPKTGLPLLAWGLISLLPVGFKLRRFGKDNQSSDDDAVSLWLERQEKIF